MPASPSILNRNFMRKTSTDLRNSFKASHVPSVGGSGLNLKAATKRMKMVTVNKQISSKEKSPTIVNRDLDSVLSNTM